MRDNLDLKLSEIRQATRHRDKLDAMVARLRDELATAKKKHDQLRKKLESEGADVRKLEGLSFQNLIVTLFGDKRTKLEVEKAELEQAQLQYDEHTTVVGALRDELAAVDAQRHSIAPDLDERYRELLNEKEEALKRSPGDASRRLAEIADEFADANSTKQEIAEAGKAGVEAASAMQKVIDALKSAENWGVADMFGGGALTTMMKHSNLDHAKTAAATASRSVRRFNRELQDIEMRTDIRIDVGSFMTFADYFADGLLIDWMVQSKIKQAKAQVEKRMRELRRILRELDSRHVEVKRRLEDLQRTRDEIVESA